MDLKGCKINIIGDSITEAVGTSEPKNVFWRLLGSIDGADMYGDGISGSRIARQACPSDDPRMDRYFRTRIPEMRKDADVILIFGGTNDYGHGDAPIGNMNDRTDDTFYGALHNLYSELLTTFPKARVVAMTPLHRLEEERQINERGIRNVGTLRDYANVIKEVAAYYAIPVLDLYEKSGIQPDHETNRELYLPDGLHPSDAGNRRIYELLKAFLVSEF
ncbi:MAG: SGNH/GDSL hydrolase family protein [Acetatifactor sp.]|nr:SGNH/GDSL hydrolase family protein [Acetatifactor sp.]